MNQHLEGLELARQEVVTLFQYFGFSAMIDYVLPCRIAANKFCTQKKNNLKAPFRIL